MTDFKYIREHLPPRKSERLSMEEFETRIGREVSMAMAEAWLECKRLDHPIVFRHNGTEVVIHPGQECKQVFRQFDRNAQHARAK